MKQILTLLIATSTFATLHAQSREDARRVILGDRKENSDRNSRDRDVIYGDNNVRYPTYPNDGNYGNNRQYQIDQVNREYDTKIQSIRNNPHLSYEEKERAIRQLERDRQNRINEINRQNGSNNGRYDNDDRNGRKDNGKHRGWYKKEKNKNWKKGKRDRDWDDR